jgi:hypothetical protein
VDEDTVIFIAKTDAVTPAEPSPLHGTWTMFNASDDYWIFSILQEGRLTVPANVTNTGPQYSVLTIKTRWGELTQAFLNTADAMDFFDIYIARWGHVDGKVCVTRTELLNEVARWQTS